MIIFDGLELIGDYRIDCVGVGCDDGRKLAEPWEDVGDGKNEDNNETREKEELKMDGGIVSLGTADGNK